jgi:hypothetical protein
MTKKTWTRIGSDRRGRDRIHKAERIDSKPPFVLVKNKKERQKKEATEEPFERANDQGSLLTGGMSRPGGGGSLTPKLIKGQKTTRST